MDIDFKNRSRCWNIFFCGNSHEQQLLWISTIPGKDNLVSSKYDLFVWPTEWYILSWMLCIISRWTILLCWGLHSMTNFSHGIQGLLVGVYFALPEHKCNICLTLKYYYAIKCWMEVTELRKSALRTWFSIKESPMQNWKIFIIFSDIKWLVISTELNIHKRRYHIYF